MDGNGTYGFTSIWGLDRDMSMSELNKIFEPGCPKCLKKKDILDYWVWHKLLLLERFSGSMSIVGVGFVKIPPYY